MKYDIINGYNRQTQYTFDDEREAVQKLWEICHTDPSGLRVKDTFIAIYGDDDIVSLCRRVDDYIWVPERKWKRWLSKGLRDASGTEDST
jgi:hypothetical protein